MESLEARLLSRIQQLKVVLRGDFKLASGRTASYYIDGRLLGLDGRASVLLGQIISQRLPKEVRSIGGPATGAIALVAATLAAAYANQRDLRGFYMRSAAKQHGRRQSFEGHPLSPAVIIDDVCSTGGSLLKVAAALEVQDIEVYSILAVFDKEQGGRTIIDQGYRYSAIFSVEEGNLTPYQSS